MSHVHDTTESLPPYARAFLLYRVTAIIVAMIVALVAQGKPCDCAERSSVPNIVFILADDK